MAGAKGVVELAEASTGAGLGKAEGISIGADGSGLAAFGFGPKVG